MLLSFVLHACTSHKLFGELAPSVHTTACVHFLHLVHNSTGRLHGGCPVWEAQLIAQTVYNGCSHPDVDLM